ncbi:MAG TPA: lipocalin family protein [Caulobacteraceae bacterium]|jgi:apolipoprotein D and lipocalin family protein|nr:lipocalin family protein [Caulobacteraceae bacterium]
MAAVFYAGQAAATAAPGPAPEPTKTVDPRLFTGRWYEIARLPNMLQKDCQAPTADWSTGQDGGYSLVQTCRVGSPSGPAKSWHAAGRIIDAIRNAKVRVGFFGGFIHQDYWIVDRGDDNSWCIMSTPTSKYLWIMSRSAVMPDEEKAALVARAHSLGYDTTRLIYDAQPPA